MRCEKTNCPHYIHLQNCRVNGVFRHAVCPHRIASSDARAVSPKDDRSNELLGVADAAIRQEGRATRPLGGAIATPNAKLTVSGGQTTGETHGED